MKAMKCELCSGTNFVRDEEFFKCEYCRTKYTPSQAKKLMETVTIDRSDEYTKLISVANSLIDSGDFEGAEKSVLKALSYNPEKVDGWLLKAKLSAHRVAIPPFDIKSARELSTVLPSLSSALKVAQDSDERLACSVAACEIERKVTSVSPGSDRYSESMRILDFALKADPNNIDVLSRKIDLATQKYRTEGLFKTEIAGQVRSEAKRVIDSSHEKLMSLGASSSYPHLSTDFKTDNFLTKHPICSVWIFAFASLIFLGIVVSFTS